MGHHNRHQEHGKSLGEKNKEHYDQVDANVFAIPWIEEMSNQIVAELQENVAWVGIKVPSSEKALTHTKMLDYACGNGLASRAFAPFVDIIRGVDISSGMAEQYNKKARDEGYTLEKKRAVQGDILNPEATPSAELNCPEFNDFDIITMCMALHHVEEYAIMIQRLSKRLNEGGVLVIVDWVSPQESGCPMAEKAQEMSGHTISRMGFTEDEVKMAYQKAGLESWSWRWASKKSRMPEELGGGQQLFFARGQKPAN